MLSEVDNRKESNYSKRGRGSKKNLMPSPHQAGSCNNHIWDNLRANTDQPLEQENYNIDRPLGRKNYRREDQHKHNGYWAEQGRTENGKRRN